MFDLALDVRLWRSWYRWKAYATLFLKVLGLRETEFGLEKYGSANRGHWGVFGPLEGIFLIEIPVRPGKILTIRESHVVSEHVLFPTHLGSRINSLWVRKTLCASTASSGGKLWNLHHSLISSVCFRVHGRRGSWCQIAAILVRRKACATYFLKVWALHRGELGFTRYDLANRGCWNVSHAGGSFSDRDSGLIGGAFNDPRVARCNRSNPLA